MLELDQQELYCKVVSNIALDKLIQIIHISFENEKRRLL